MRHKFWVASSGTGVRVRHFNPVLTLCDPMDCSPPSYSVHGLSQQEQWSGLPRPPPGDLPAPGIEPSSLMSPSIGRQVFYHWRQGTLIYKERAGISPRLCLP